MTIDCKKAGVSSAAAVTAFSAGALSPARHAIIACQSEMLPDVKSDIAFQDQLAAHLMTQEPSVPLSPDFFDRLALRLDDVAHDDWVQDDRLCNDDPQVETIQTLSMSALNARRASNSTAYFSKDYLKDVKWKILVPGVSISYIMEPRIAHAGERLFLLKVKGGMKMPFHSHRGEEWTLVLQGGYNVGETNYSRGDLHISNDNDAHAPHINPGQDCICLVMTEGPLKMQAWLPRLMQPIIGI